MVTTARQPTAYQAYIDGQWVDAAPKNLDIRGDFKFFTVGVDNWWRTTFHYLTDGAVDEVKVYDYELSDTEVSDLYWTELVLP